jgi:hypothetical protein
LIPRLSSPELAGGTLAALALGEIVPPPGATYASVVRGRLTWSEPSDLARNDALRGALWRDSEALVGLDREPAQRTTTSAPVGRPVVGILVSAERRTAVHVLKVVWVDAVHP